MPSATHSFTTASRGSPRGACLGEHEIHAIDARGIPDEPQHSGDHGPHIRCLEQQAARLRRSGQQALAAL